MTTTHSTPNDRGHLRAVGSKGRREGGKPRGLTIERFFTRAGEDPFDAVAWELRGAKITGEGGEVVFEQKDVEIPKSWSQLAANVVVSKYFRGHLDASDRERSVKQLIGRVVGKIREWGDASGYFATPDDSQSFADELTHVLVTQRMAFNSPVWFNLGVKDTPQQASACFINSVDDTMESISDHAFFSSFALQWMNSMMSGWSTFRITILAARRVLPPDFTTPANASKPRMNETGPEAVPPPASRSREERIRDRFTPEPDPPLKMTPSLRYQSRIESMVSSTERMKQAEHCGCFSTPTLNQTGELKQASCSSSRWVSSSRKVSRPARSVK